MHTMWAWSALQYSAEQTKSNGTMTNLCRADGRDPGRHVMPEYFDTSLFLDGLPKKCQLKLQSSQVSTVFHLGK